MGTLERTEALTHRIGSNGRVSVKTLTGTLRIRGVEGDDAHLAITYRIRADDQSAAERALDTGRVIVDRGSDWLDVETPDRRVSTGIAWLFGGARVRADISLDVPWGTRVRYETMSGSIEAMALVGDQRYKTVSGDIRLWSIGGLVEAGSITGSIVLDRGGDVRLRANTVSGGIRVRARRFHGLTVSTTDGRSSGRVDLRRRRAHAAERSHRRAAGRFRLDSLARATPGPGRARLLALRRRRRPGAFQSQHHVGQSPHSRPSAR